MRKSMYYQQPYQEILVKKVKARIRDLLAGLTAEPEKGRLARAKNTVLLAREFLGLLRDIRSLPKPTRENTATEAAHSLIELRDWYFARLQLPVISGWLEYLADALVIIVDTDFYREFVIAAGHKFRSLDWPANGPMQPDPHFWREVETK